MSVKSTTVAASSAELDQLVKEADLGGREPKGKVGAFQIGRASCRERVSVLV